MEINVQSKHYEIAFLLDELNGNSQIYLYSSIEIWDAVSHNTIKENWPK